MLDLAIVSVELMKYVSVMEIDNMRTFTAFRGKGGKNIQFPDHYAIHLEFEGIPKVKDEKNEKIEKKKNPVLWNTNKKDGWTIYERLTNSNVKLDRIATDDTNDPDEIMESIEKELERVKYKAFGKVRFSKKNEDSKMIELMEEKKLLMNKNAGRDAAVDALEGIDDKICSELKAQQKK